MKCFLDLNKKLDMGNSGFTLVEIMVVIGIMAVVASLILFNSPAFNDRLGTQRAAEEIASSARQAQAYGLGVKEAGMGSGIFPGYGLYFQNASNGSYIFFADKNGNSQYDSDEEISDNIIENGVQIFDLCANQKQTAPGPCGLSNLTVLFLRPQPQVSLKSGASSYADIEIKIRGSRGTTKIIVFWLSGQVSIE
jgi:prepilin-type N-terminal cleavage/methylation domain-containing protein